MTTAKFKVAWNFDGTASGTVLINREAGTFAVRPFHRKASYELPLAFVAQIVAERVIKAEILKKRLEKARKKKEQLAFRKRNR